MRMLPTPQTVNHDPNVLPLFSCACFPIWVKLFDSSHGLFLFVFLVLCLQDEFIKSAFQDIVSAEFEKLKDSSLNDNIGNDVLWEYDDLKTAYEGDCEDILLEMQTIFYEDLSREPTRKGDDCSFTSYIMFYTVNFGSRNDDVIIGKKKV